jgi:hypothetical protein
MQNDANGFAENIGEEGVMKQRMTINKLYFVWDFEKEEDWLNEMALKGWVLERVGFTDYHFEACEPGEYTVRLEMRSFDEDYLAFLEDTGAEYIGRIFAWIYLRKKTADGPFDIFSDIDSRIRHLDRICKMLLVVGAFNLLIGLINHVGAGWINLLCSTILMYALGRIHGKKEALVRERLLRE